MDNAYGGQLSCVVSHLSKFYRPDCDVPPLGRTSLGVSANLKVSHILHTVRRRKEGEEYPSNVKQDPHVNYNSFANTSLTEETTVSPLTETSRTLNAVFPFLTYKPIDYT
ncbi:hypothetical protein TNCV_2288141 [Trichonephila clavipes]|nr:hypothetical protein TNCV_2288141 [Trichonephila clavipes]